MITQRKLVLNDRPTLVLSTVAGAREKLAGHDEDDILALVEEGHLLHAWNIALSTGPEVARDIRIWPDCIDHYQAALGHRPYPRTQDQVISQICMTACGNQPCADTTKIRLILNCGATHILNLLKAGVLEQQPGTHYTRGPSGAALITVGSLTAFLRNRTA